MPGSPSDPVRLDPWTNIIEVGWGNSVLWLAVAIEINGFHGLYPGRTYGGEPITETGDDPSTFMLDQTETGHGYGYPGPPLLNAAWAKQEDVGSEWFQAVVFAEVPPFDFWQDGFAEFTKQGFAAGGNNWELGSGGGQGQHVPEYPSISFDGGLNPRYQMIGKTAGGGGEWWDFSPGPGFAPRFGVTGAVNDVVEHDDEYPLSDLAVVYGATEFDHIATAFEAENPFHLRGVLWLLLKRPGQT